MLFDDLTLETKILIGLLAPLTLTLICWFVGPLFDWLAQLGGGSKLARVLVILLGAYLVFAIALREKPLPQWR